MGNVKKMENYVKNVEASQKAVDAAHTKVNEALANKDLNEYGNAMAQLTKAVKALNEHICRAEYVKFTLEEHPMIAAIKQFKIETVVIKEEKNKESGIVVGVKLNKRETNIDLLKFCEFVQIDKTWAHEAFHLLELLALREADVFKMNPSELAKRTRYFCEKAAAKKNGETPDSNTQIVKQLQKVVDLAIFVDDGNGKNSYKCTNHDIAFILDAATKIDTKEKGTIAMVKERDFRIIMLNVFSHCIGEIEAYKVVAPKAKKSN